MSIFKQHPAVITENSELEGSVAELFHENTKLWPDPTVAPELLPPPKLSVDEILTIARAYKTYTARPHVTLPDPISGELDASSFDEVIAARRTIRSFGSGDMDLVTLSTLLHQTYGVTGAEQTVGGGVIRLRAAPSAGALYPVEIYLAVRRVAGLAEGIYHYEPITHSLALLRAGDPTPELLDACCLQPHVTSAAVTVLFSGVFERTMRKYGARGYRYVLLDAGHVAQNLCLSATSLQLAVTTTCGFFDDRANDLLGLGGLDEAVLYVAFVGPLGSELTETLDENSEPSNWPSSDVQSQ